MEEVGSDAVEVGVAGTGWVGARSLEDEVRVEGHISRELVGVIRMESWVLPCCYCC